MCVYCKVKPDSYRTWSQGRLLCIPCKSRGDPVEGSAHVAHALCSLNIRGINPILNRLKFGWASNLGGRDMNFALFLLVVFVLYEIWGVAFNIMDKLVDQHNAEIAAIEKEYRKRG